MKSLVVILALFAASASAQVATLTGRITDPSGAVIPQAKISIRSLSTGSSTTAETTSEGYYTLPATNLASTMSRFRRLVSTP